MSKILKYLPELEGDEQVHVAQLLKPMTDSEAEKFAHVYRARRKDPQTVMLLTLLGFVIVAGVQRFYLDQMGMGILYLLTGGLCLVGTIIDLLNYQNMALKYNQKQADSVAQLVT